MSDGVEAQALPRNSPLSSVRTVSVLNSPTWGPFSGLISFVHDAHNGDIRNLGAGTVWDRPGTNEGVQGSPLTLGAQNENTVFAALKFQPNDDLDVAYKFDWAQDDYTPDGQGLLGIDPAALGPDGALLTSALAPPNAYKASSRRPRGSMASAD